MKCCSGDNKDQDQRQDQDKENFNRENYTGNVKISSAHNRGNHPSTDHKGHGSHWMMMAICCGLPVLLLLLLPFIGSVFPGIQGSMARILPFLCPILMVFMMISMSKKHKTGSSIKPEAKDGADYLSNM